MLTLNILLLLLLYIYIYIANISLHIPAGSPYRVDIHNQEYVTKVLDQDVQYVPVGRLADFEVQTGTINGDLVANITCKDV